MDKFSTNPSKIIYIKNGERDLADTHINISDENFEKRSLCFFDAYVVEKGRDLENMKPETA